MTIAPVAEPPVAARGGSPRAPVAWAYALAGALGALALFRYVDPNGGAVEHRPWELPSPFEWSRAAATQLFFTLLAVAPLVAAFRPATRARGALVGLALALSLTALAALAHAPGAESVYYFGVETYVPPLLAACVAASLYGSRATGRGIGLAAVAGAVLATLLVYPSGPDVPATRGAGPRYSAPLPDLARDVVRRTGTTDEQRRAAVESGASVEGATAAEVLVHPWSVAAILSLVVGVCGVASALAPRARRALAWTAFAAFLAIVAYPLAWLCGEVFLRPELHEPGLSRFAALLRGLGVATRYTYAPFVLGLFAAATDVLRDR